MHFNKHVQNTEFPPVTEAANWVAGREFPDHLPLIDVSQAVPGYPTSDNVLDYIAQAIRQPAVSKYGHALGHTPLREHYAASLHSNVDASNVAITAGCNQAFYVAVAALCNPGDNVILPLPWYFNHKMSLDMLGIEAIPLPCDADNHLLPDPQVAATLINNRTRAIVLISPNNPTGQVYPPEIIDAFYALCRGHNKTLVIDETYCDFRPDTSKSAHQIFNNPDWADHVVQLYSFSKAYALAGYRVGTLVGSPALLIESTKVLDCVSICAPQISQQAASYALQHAGAWKEQKRDLMYQRADAFRDAMNNQNHSYEVAAIGAYFAYLKHPFDLPSRVLAKHLADKANILSLPGDMFGPHQQQYLRVAFANVDQEKMPAIAERLSKFTP